MSNPRRPLIRRPINLARIPKHELQKVGWSKATELVKVARKDRESFDCATWLHKAKELPKERFKSAVERHLTGKDTEPWEILYFKVYKSQLPVIEKALETAALMLGTEKSRGLLSGDDMRGFPGRGSSRDNSGPISLTPDK
jgi:hypothetical protein